MRRSCRVAVACLVVLAGVSHVAPTAITAPVPAPVPAIVFDLQNAPVRGLATAPVTIVEFSDFQCGFCSRATGTLVRLLERYPGRVRWIMKHYPLDFHDAAPLAHRAALAAQQQGKFWEMHDAIFAAPKSLGRQQMLRHAARLTLDMDRFVRDMEGPRVKALLDRDMAEGRKAGVDGTPTLFVNGARVVGAVPYETLAASVERALAVALAGTPEGLEEAMSRGPSGAPVTIRWFADLSSSLHREAMVMLRKVVDTYGDDVRVSFKHLPSPDRDYARPLHEAAVSAAEQGAFWQLHDVLMNRGAGQSADVIAGFAARLGMDRGRFVTTLSGPSVKETLVRHAAEARLLDVRGTPTFFVNERRVDGLVPVTEMIKIIDEQLRAPPTVSRDPR